MSARAARRVAQLVGADVLTIEDEGVGWPVAGSLITEDGPMAVALFVSAIGLGGRRRDEVERRFQNPPASDAEHVEHGWRGRPLVIPAGRVPLLMGLWESDSYIEDIRPVLVLADPHKRAGLVTRHSVFVRLAALREAEATGVAESVSADGEIMPCLHPALLPAAALAVTAGVGLPLREVEIAIGAAGLMDASSDEPAAVERARRTVTTIVRDRRFRGWVVNAYGGCCAMCGLGIDQLVEGAHVHPVGAQGGLDTVRNGICLCANHHSAFDGHLVWVDPGDLSVRLHPSLLTAAETNPAIAAFVESTRDVLAQPLDPEHGLLPEMLASRYVHFEAQYGWL